jgi:molybdopterin/thiamine biosynthesis adenylyltransferase
MSLPMFSPVNSLGKTLGRRERPPRRCLRARPADGQVDHESGRFRWLAGGSGRPVNRRYCGHDAVSDSLGLGNHDHVRAWASVIVASARSAAAKVTVAGLGALGQNLLQTLALSGVGGFLLIDYDSFEDHNATRSPFFPTAAELELFGRGKAPIVAHRASAISTASQPQILFQNDTVQRCGDRIIRWADVIVAAVDSVSARAWLAERARLHGKPLVEGGFSGPEFNFSAFSADPGADCYRCFNPAKVSSASCTQYAVDAERQNVVPAIQATAAIVGGLMAEQVINIIHGTEIRYGSRQYGNVRRAAMHSALLRRDPQCPGQHDPLMIQTLRSARGALRTVADLLAASRSSRSMKSRCRWC